MEFDHAAQRLARDQSRLVQKGRRPAKPEMSSQAKRQALLQKQMAAQRAAQRQVERRQKEYQETCIRDCERNLQVKRLVIGSSSSNNNSSNTSSNASSNHGLLLHPTSIYGEGDKIALPPSILEFLTATNNNNKSDDTNSLTLTSSSSPWTFRVGILNPNYSFPASPLVQTLKPPNDDSEHDDDDDDDDYDSDQEEEDNPIAAAYLDELNFKYLAYTHATVVEFTQDEGHVGLPEPIAKALLLQQRTRPNNNKTSVPVKRTVDPAQTQQQVAVVDDEIGGDGGDSSKNDAVMIMVDTTDVDHDEKTPGHFAWGAFDLPDMAIEVSLVQLPKGKACRLIPTQQALEHGFYNLADIKLVLEQSLIRTRATLSVGDVVHTWHRGKKFDLVVATVTPSRYNSVTCINTDIEVEFGEVDATAAAAEHHPHGKRNNNNDDYTTMETTDTTEKGGGGGGRVLSAPSQSVSQPQTSLFSSSAAAVMKFKFSKPLLPEPPLEQTEGVVTVQVRADGAVPGKRRFDIHRATVQDLFAFSASILLDNNDNNNTSSSSMSLPCFQLVTRFPRRVLTLDNSRSRSRSPDATGNATSTLAQVGIQPGQELFMVERLV